MDQFKETLPESRCYCLKSFSGPCLYCAIASDLNATWAKLSVNEKSKLIAYMRILLSNKKPSSLMVNYVTSIYEKYPDFSTACIPI
jgi:hypothetical protein